MINILIAGDYCPQDRIAGMIEKDDFSFFDEIRPVIANTDYSLVNLECPIADEKDKPIIKCGPSLRCTPKALDALLYAGFNGVTLANNHLNDYGEKAILNTLNLLKEKSIDKVGGGRFLKDSNLPLCITLDNKVVSVVNFCESEFSIASAYTAGATPLDLVDNQRIISECRTKSDYVIVIVHSGHEMHQLPSPMMQKTYRWFIEMGADAVVNHHQHCFSGYEVYRDKPIFYGLGNFCFDRPTQRNTIWNEGYMVRLILSEGIDFEIIPYQQCNDSPDIKMLKDEEKEVLNHQINELNNIIQDPLLVEASFDRYYKQSRNWILAIFSPYTNRILRGAARKGYLPFFLPKKKLASLYDYINCEAHRNIVLNCLHDEL